MITQFNKFENSSYFHSEEEINDILQKIHDNGYPSLSDSERAILINYSKDDADLEPILADFDKEYKKLKNLYQYAKEYITKNNLNSVSDKQKIDQHLDKYLDDIRLKFRYYTDLLKKYNLNPEDIKNYRKYKIGGQDDFDLNESIELSGKHSFFTFLQIISNHDFHFILNNHYTKLYNYHFYFSTETIKSPEEYVEIFKYKNSLSSCYKILLDIKDNKLGFFFGIKDNNLLRYGFIDLSSQRSYVAGEFHITGKYFRSISKYKCIQFVNKIIQNVDVKNISTLSQIRKDFQDFYKSKKNKKIVMIDNKITNLFDRNQFTEEDLQMNRLSRALDEWIAKKSWRNKVEFSVNDVSDPIEFIIIVK